MLEWVQGLRRIINEKVKLPQQSTPLENNTPEKVKVTYDEVKDIGSY